MQLESSGELYRINYGVTALNSTSGYEEEKVTFIGDENSTTFDKTKNVEYTLTCMMFSEDETPDERDDEYEVLKWLYYNGFYQNTGTDLEAWLIKANLFEGGSCTAIKSRVKYTPDNPGGGNGGDMANFTGKLAQQGNATKGTFSPTSKTFTAAAG
jgi:hypothetical protein